jgi:hypothetical protein
MKRIKGLGAPFSPKGIVAGHPLIIKKQCRGKMPCTAFEIRMILTLLNIEEAGHDTGPA